MSDASDVIIIGAGIIGLAIAERLSHEGLLVRIFDSGAAGQEASAAAAGMLAPHAEAAQSTPAQLTRLFEASHALYPRFIDEVESRSGMKVGFRTGGSLSVALDYQEARVLAGLLGRMQEADRHVQELDSHDLRKLQPGLSEQAQAGLFFPDDAFVNNRELVQALLAATQKNGAELFENMPVLEVLISGGRATGIRTADGRFSGGTVVVAAGCWSGLITDSIKLEVRPIRGQIVRLQVEKQFLSHLIHSSSCYIVPWPDGRTLVGSTLENVGFNKKTTAQGIHELLRAAIEVVPDIGRAAVIDTWAGLRPDTRDNLPVLGRTDIDSLILATGHFRNGILLTPITAQLISELIFGGTPSIPLSPFQLDRFNSSPRAESAER